MNTLVLRFVFLMLLATAALALKCYKCTNCITPTNEVDGCSYCMMTRVEMSGVVTTDRTCGTGNPPKIGCEHACQSGVCVDVCICNDRDLCNGGSGVRKCYDCKDCETPTNEVSNCGYCTKEITESGGKQTVTRSCVSGLPSKLGCETSNNQGTITTTCNCEDRDLCNAGSLKCYDCENCATPSHEMPACDYCTTINYGTSIARRCATGDPPMVDCKGNCVSACWCQKGNLCNAAFSSLRTWPWSIALAALLVYWQ